MLFNSHSTCLKEILLVTLRSTEPSDIFAWFNAEKQSDYKEISRAAVLNNSRKCSSHCGLCGGALLNCAVHSVN